MNKYAPLKLESNAQLNDIFEVSFTPVKEVTVKKVVNKGGRRFWKFLGFIPFIPYKSKVDLYKSDEWNNRKLTLKDGLAELNSYNKELAFINNDKLFFKARVIVKRLNFAWNREYFRTNEEAIKFIDDLKIKCKMVGNELK